MSLAPRILEAGGERWRYLPETAPAGAARAQALARAQLIDELTGMPPPGRATVTTSTVGARPAAGEGGHVGLSGRPATLFPDPWPAAAPFPELAFDVALPGFLPLALRAALAAQPGWPGDYALQDFGTVALHRRPTLISGRIASRAAGPVAGALVEVTEVWPSFDAIGGAGLPANALTIWAGLYADRPAGATLRRRTLTLQAPAKTLERTANAGDTRIRLSDRQGLVLNRPLAIEPGDPERAEYILATAVDAAAAPDLPAWVDLAHPLARAHAAGTAVQRTTMAVAGPVNTLTRDARRGDLSLFADGLGGIAPANTTIEVDGGGPAAEYHGFALWRAATTDDSYRLPPIHRVAHLRLRASGGGQPNPTEILVSLTGPGEAAADLVFP